MIFKTIPQRVIFTATRVTKVYITGLFPCIFIKPNMPRGSKSKKNARKRSQKAGLSTEKAKIHRERLFIYQDDDII